MSAIAVVATVLMTGCGVNGPGTPSQVPDGSTPTSVATSATSQEPAMLDRVVLTADLSEPAARWHLVAQLPFGPAAGELGYIPANPEHESGVAGVPPSFAVGPGGSLWILDAIKERVAHYSATGRYLGSVGHFPWKTRWETRDLVWLGNTLFVLLVHSWTVASDVITIEDSTQSKPTTITLHGDPATLHTLVPGARSLTGYVNGYAELNGHDPGEGPWGMALLEVPGSGGAQMLPGVPLRDGTFMDMSAVPEAETSVSFQAQGRQTTLPITYRLVPKPGSKSLRLAQGSHVEGVLEHGLIVWVQFSPALPKDADRFGGGRWFLQVSEDGSALVWERLPDPQVPDEFQYRHLTVGPDGNVYLMLPTKDGVEIYRR